MQSPLIERIRSGDLSALDGVYLEVKPKFIAFARRQFPGVPAEELHDIYQDAIIVFYQNIKRGLLTEITSSVSAYIIQIGKIKLIQHTDKENRQRAMQEVYADQRLDEAEYDGRLDQAVKFIFSKMSDACKQILQLFYFERKSMEEIARLLDYKNADTVKSKKSRCISTFHDHVNQLYFDE